MAVRQKNGRWIVELRQGGVRVFRRLHKGATKAQATALETKIRSDLFAAQRLGQSPEPSLAAAIQLWLEETIERKKDRRGPRQNAVLLAPHVIGKTLAQAPDAAREAIAAWKHLAPGTVNRRLAVIKAACTYAWRQGWAAQNYSGKISRLREPPGRQVYLSRAEVNRLADAADEPLRSIILIASYTGLRAGELRVAVPSLDRKTILLPDSKNGKPRTIPVAARVRPLLKILPIDVPYSRIEWAFRAARERAGLPHVRLHDLRHTAASWLINSGSDLYTVGTLLGHRAVATSARYAHLSHSTLTRAVARLK